MMQGTPASPPGARFAPGAAGEGAVHTGYVLELVGGFFYVGKTTQKLPERLAQHRGGQHGSKWTRRHPLKQCVRQCQVSASQASGWETNTTAQWMLLKGVNRVRGAGLTHDRDYGPQDEDLLVRTIGHALDLDFDDVRQRIRSQLQQADVAAAGLALQRGPAGSFAAAALELECPYCPRDFATEELRAAHMPACLHSLFGTDCRRCGRPGHWKDKCKHVTDIRGDTIEDVWKCESCGAKFGTEAQADRHLEHCQGASQGSAVKRGRFGGCQDEDVCFRCGRPGHWQNSCDSSEHVDGRPLDGSESDVWECRSCGVEFDTDAEVQRVARYQGGSQGSGGKRSRPGGSQGDGCFRCGGSSHWASSCFANTHLDGSRLG